MERIFPCIEVIKKLHQESEKGELDLLSYLDKNLPRDDKFNEDQDLSEYNGWLIFFQPYLNGARPDIIIFNPKVGVQIFEVKDWHIEKYKTKREKEKTVFSVINNGNYQQIRSPVQQVDYYKNKIIEQLVPQIGEAVDLNKKNYGVIRTSVFFSKFKNNEVIELFSEKELKNHIMFSGELLEETNCIGRIVPLSLKKESEYWKKEWNKDLIFWLLPPIHSLEAVVPIELNRSQRKFAEPETGHFRVRGVAGSGKTMVLAYRAAKLASLGKKVLILTYNITLWHFIRDQIQRVPIKFDWKNITMNHFHGFCNDIFNRYNEEWPSDNHMNEEEKELLFTKIIPKKVIEVLKKNNHDKFDAILIDEGQDYCYEWYDMLQHLLSKNNELIVVCDKDQNVYTRNLDWLDKRRKGVEKFPDWIELRIIYRLPEDVVDLAENFLTNFGIKQEVKVEHVIKSNNDLNNLENIAIRWKNINDEEWLNEIDCAYEYLKKLFVKIHPSDVVILIPTHSRGIECVNHFKNNKHIESNYIFEDLNEMGMKPHKKSFWLGDGRLKMSTIYSFKGWEAQSVIILVQNIQKVQNDRQDKLLYTAITRTKQNLIILNSNPRYFNFGEALSDKYTKYE